MASAGKLGLDVVSKQAVVIDQGRNSSTFPDIARGTRWGVSCSGSDVGWRWYRVPRGLCARPKSDGRAGREHEVSTGQAPIGRLAVAARRDTDDTLKASRPRVSGC